MAEFENPEEHARLRRLYRVLIKQFHPQELSILCFDLNIPYLDLGGEGHKAKALEVVLWCQRNRRVDELEAALALPDTAPQDSEVWRAAMERYRERIEETCGWMQILGQPKPVPLDDIFTEVYLLDKPTAWRRFTVEQLQEEFASRETRERRERRLDGLALIGKAVQAKQSQRLFILGKPGAGKTTFLKQVALQAARQEFANEHRIPIFVTLKRLADSGQSVLDFITSDFVACQLPVARGVVVGWLRSGRALVLFDGLDEVPQSNERQASLVEALHAFVRDHPKNHYLITCRIAAADYTFEGFTCVEMADFTPAQVATFVGKWFREDAATRNLFRAELRKPEHRPLQELATVPLLLTLLCLAFEETLNFPQRRVELYEEALDALLKKWDNSRRIRRDEAYHKLSLGRKRELFAEIAWQSFEQGRYFIPQSDLAAHLVEYLHLIPPVEQRAELDGEVILQAIEAQHGVLIERARRIYAFAHLTFQEYYVARYIVDHLVEPIALHLFTHTPDPRWREVFLLVTSLLPRTRADEFFAQWLKHLRKLSQQQGAMSLLDWTDAQNLACITSRSELTKRSLCLHQGLTFVFIFNHNCNRILELARALDLDVTLKLDLEHALDRSRILDLDITIGFDLEHTLLRAHELDRDHARDRDRVLDLDLDLALDLDRVLDRVLLRSRAREFASELASVLALARDLGSALGYMMLAAEGITSESGAEDKIFRPLYQRILKAILDINASSGLNQLHITLRSFKYVSTASHEGWQTRSRSLHNLTEAHLTLPPTDLLTEEAIATLESYLASTQLLLECLEVAFVSDKEAILDSLLRPPGWTRT